MKTGIEQQHRKQDSEYKNITCRMRQSLIQFASFISPQFQPGCNKKDSKKAKQTCHPPYIIEK